MSEVARTFVWAEARHEEADSAAKARLCPLGGFAQIGLKLAEGHLDRIEIGRVLGQISQIGTNGLDRFLDPGDLVGPSPFMAPSITKGAVISSQRRPATNVSVSQVPNGTRPINRSPHGHRP